MSKEVQAFTSMHIWYHMYNYMFANNYSPLELVSGDQPLL